MSYSIMNLITPAMIVEARQGRAPVHMYCDMDGVVANFQSVMQDEFGLGDAKTVDKHLRQPESWPSIAVSHPNLFNLLPQMPDAKVLMSGLLTLRDRGVIDLSMLTALPEEWMADPKLKAQGTLDKQRWVVRHFQRMKAEDVIVCRRSEKVRYAVREQVVHQRPAVLIDDYKKNIDQWRDEGGGVGILHTSAQDSLAQLREYLSTKGV